MDFSLETYVRNALDLQEIKGRFGMTNNSDLADVLGIVWNQFDSSGYFQVSRLNNNTFWDGSNQLTVEGLENNAKTNFNSVYVGAVAATTTIPIFRAPVACTMVTLGLLTSNTTGGTDSSSYYAWQLYNYTDSTDLFNSVSSDSSGIELTANTDVPFTLDRTAVLSLEAGDQLSLIMTKTGDPGNLAGFAPYVIWRVTS